MARLRETPVMGTSTVIALILYFSVLIGIGLITYKKDEDMEGYAPGGDGPWGPGSLP